MNVSATIAAVILVSVVFIILSWTVVIPTTGSSIPTKRLASDFPKRSSTVTPSMGPDHRAFFKEVEKIVDILDAEMDSTNDEEVLRLRHKRVVVKVVPLGRVQVGFSKRFSVHIFIVCFTLSILPYINLFAYPSIHVSIRCVVHP